MDEQKFHENILVSVALILCAGIIFYNFFFVPDLSAPTIIYVDKNSGDNEDSVEGEVFEGQCVNINTADVEEISDVLPGVGKVTAERIIEYRESNGLFKSIEDLMQVKGIGEKSFDKIKNLICV